VARSPLPAEWYPRVGVRLRHNLRASAEFIGRAEQILAPMKRTHVMHTRDNRRPHYFKQVDHHDTRPVIEWRHDGEKQVLHIDGKPVARVEPVGGCGSWDYEFNQPREARHDAIILAGPHCGERKAFPDDCDSARLYCERLFAA